MDWVTVDSLNFTVVDKIFYGIFSELMNGTSSNPVADNRNMSSDLIYQKNMHV